jgi:hypothetical protein
MSKTSTKPRLRCTSVDFIEIECQRPIVPRLVIRLTQGITILMESSADFPLACEFISGVSNCLFNIFLIGVISLDFWVIQC